MSDSLPNDPRINFYRFRCAEGDESILLEVTFPDVATAAIAIVIDHSDSCESAKIAAIVNDLSKPINEMPLSWKMWIYDLGSAVSLSDVRATLSYYRDEISHITETSSLPSVANKWRTRGSFFGPVLDSITSRCQQESVQSMTVFVITDGELFDSEAQELPEHVTVIGIHPRGTLPHLEHWHRVLPNSPLLSLDDPSLDSILCQQSGLFSIGCEIEFEDVASHFRWHHLDIPTKTLRLLPKGPIKFDVGTKTEYLYTDSVGVDFANFSVRCRALKSDVIRRIKPSETVVPTEVRDILHAAIQAKSTSSPLILDATFSGQNYSEVWAEYSEAVRRAEKKDIWLDEKGCIAVFQNLTDSKRAVSEDGYPKWDAMLAVSNRAVSNESKGCHIFDGTRVIVIGLTKDHEFEWDGEIVPGVHLETGSALFRFERRAWTMTTGDGQSINLGRDRSRLITELRIIGWTTCMVAFSGSLR